MATAVRVERTTRAGRAGLAVGVLALLALATLPAWGAASTMRVLVEFIALLMLAQMWNLLAGYGGGGDLDGEPGVGLPHHIGKVSGCIGLRRGRVETPVERGFSVEPAL